MSITFKSQIFCIALFLLGSHVFPQDQNISLRTQDKKEIIEKVAQRLEDNYVLEETAKAYSSRLRNRFAAGEYDKILNPEQFSRKLQDDLREVYPDGHLSVFYDPSFFSTLKEREQSEDTSRIIDSEFERQHNGGFKEVKILEGNIGYLKFDGFMYLTDRTRKAADHALGFLSNSNSLIIDLRENLGGSPTMIQHLMNYFFEEPTHFNTFYDRSTDTKSEKWTVPVSSSPFTKIPIYILTSKRSFSAAEEFAYDLQQLGRGTVIGERTGGGAHPVRPYAITKGYIVNIPYAMAINPKSNTNWEGTGVSPDVQTDEEKSIYKAVELALSHALLTATNEEAKAALEWYKKRNSAFLEPIIPQDRILKKLVGTYGENTISESNGDLIYSSGSGPVLSGSFELLPVSDYEFFVKQVENLKLIFEINEKGQITALRHLWQDGRTESFKKHKA